VTRETTLDLIFAGGVVVAAASLAAAAIGRAPRSALLFLAGLLGLAATAGWVVFALHPSRELAVAASGLTTTMLLELGAVALGRGVARARRVEEDVAAAEDRITALIEQETERRTSELERTLARARADSVSLLVEEERRIADQRRALTADHEREATSKLTDALTATSARIEQRLADWRADLERTEESLATQLTALAQRQGQLISDAEARLRADAEGLDSASEDQRAAVARLREELTRTAQKAVETATAELTAHEGERRRALHEVSDRLRQRERELRDRIAREETEAVARIQSSFADVERRQADQLSRVVERTANRLSEAAAAEFSDRAKTARDDAAKRLARELERAVESFARQAQTVLAERLAQVADAGGQRVDQRLNQIRSMLDEERDEVLGGYEKKLADAELELQARLQALAADAEAERAVIEARLHELARRVAELSSGAEARVPETFRAE